MSCLYLPKDYVLHSISDLETEINDVDDQSISHAYVMEPRYTNFENWFSGSFPG